MQPLEDTRVTSDVTRAMYADETTPAFYFRRKLREGFKWKMTTFKVQVAGATFNEPMIEELIRDGYEIPLIQQLVKKGNYKHERIQAIKAKVEAEKEAAKEAANG